MIVVRSLGLVLAVAVLVGCSGAQPMEYHDPTETPKGPGLFTGESGAKTFTVEGDAQPD